MSNLGFYGVSDATPFWVEPAGASGRLGRSRGGSGSAFERSTAAMRCARARMRRISVPTRGLLVTRRRGTHVGRVLSHQRSPSHDPIRDSRCNTFWRVLARLGAHCGAPRGDTIPRLKLPRRTFARIVGLLRARRGRGPIARPGRTRLRAARRWLLGHFVFVGLPLLKRR